MLNSRTSRTPSLMRLLHSLLLSAARHSFSSSSRNIQGIDNLIADSLSRGAACTNINSHPAAVGLDPSTLESQCEAFLMHGLSLSTHRTYATAKRKLKEFCKQLGNLHLSGSPCLANDWTVCLFATFLAQSVHHSTIKVYLSGVGVLQVGQTPLRTLITRFVVLHSFSNYG